MLPDSECVQISDAPKPRPLRPGPRLFHARREITRPMVDGISGTDWRPEELHAIVADYFDMLAADLSGQPYVKSRHRALLVSKLGRSNGSIEFKYQNISAVLDELGAQWIPGYKPAKNYQNTIFDAIDFT
jgi:hypothetical protein